MQSEDVMSTGEVSLKELKDPNFKPKKYDVKKAEKALTKIRAKLKAYADEHGDFSLVDELLAERRREVEMENTYSASLG